MTQSAKAAYAEAVAAVCSRTNPVDALRRAVEADPDFAVAAADLLALTGEGPPQPPVAATSWERRHIEIIDAAASDPLRAEALLREHAARSGCDPLALLVVSRQLDGIDGERLADLRGRACTCWGVGDAIAAP